MFHFDHLVKYHIFTHLVKKEWGKAAGAAAMYVGWLAAGRLVKLAGVGVRKARKWWVLNGPIVKAKAQVYLRALARLVAACFMLMGKNERGGCYVIRPALNKRGCYALKA